MRRNSQIVIRNAAIMDCRTFGLQAQTNTREGESMTNTKPEYEFKTPEEALAQLVEDCGTFLTAGARHSGWGFKA